MLFLQCLHSILELVMFHFWCCIKMYILQISSSIIEFSLHCNSNAGKRMHFKPNCSYFTALPLHCSFTLNICSLHNFSRKHVKTFNKIFFTYTVQGLGNLKLNQRLKWFTASLLTKDYGFSCRVVKKDKRVFLQRELGNAGAL